MPGSGVAMWLFDRINAQESIPRLAAQVAALVELLIAADVFTGEQWEKAVVRMQAEVDQYVAGGCEREKS